MLGRVCRYNPAVEEGGRNVGIDTQCGADSTMPGYIRICVDIVLLMREIPCVIHNVMQS